MLRLTHFKGARGGASCHRSFLAVPPSKNSSTLIPPLLGRGEKGGMGTIEHCWKVNHFKLWNAELHVLLRDDQERKLKEAGFEELTFYGSYDFDPYNNEHSDNLIRLPIKVDGL
jgi:hypothetical protein